MFALNINILENIRLTVLRNFVRNNKLKHMKHRKRRLEVNPGINLQRKLISNKDSELDNEDLDNLEADFINLDKSYEEHNREMGYLKEKMKFHIVKQKYFKQNLPNFLTWSDKAQIKYLHSKNPEEWTVEQLAEGFPAVPEVIAKIIKSKWTKKNETKIKNHDEAVQENWKLFKTGKLMDLPHELTNHLNKFTERKLNFEPFITPHSTKTSPAVLHKHPLKTEFSDIITSYELLRSKTKFEQSSLTQKTNDPEIKKLCDTESIKSNKAKRGRHITLSELRQNIEVAASSGQEVIETDLQILKEYKAKGDEAGIIKLAQVDVPAKTSKTGKVMMQKSEKDNSHLSYPDKIVIPKKIRKRGYTYKLNDCYYDDEGIFLYRVPGMG